MRADLPLPRVVMSALVSVWVGGGRDAHRLPRRGLHGRSAHRPADSQEMIQVRPTSRQPHHHPPRAGDHLRRHLDQPRPPRARERSAGVWTIWGLWRTGIPLPGWPRRIRQQYRHLLKNRLRPGSSSASVGSSAGSPSSADVGGACMTVFRRRTSRFNAAVCRYNRKKFARNRWSLSRSAASSDFNSLLRFSLSPRIAYSSYTARGSTAQPTRLVTTARRLVPWACASILMTTGCDAGQLSA